MQNAKKIPMILGLLLVTATVSGIIFISENLFRTRSQASISTKPQKITITNISDTVFSVTWLTDEETTGALQVSSVNSKEKLYYDDRDQNGKFQKYTTHSVTVRNTAPSTRYNIRIISNGKAHQDETKPPDVLTGPALTEVTPNTEPAYGMIVLATGEPAKDALVYVTLEGGQTLSTVTNLSGSWLVPLNVIRTEDLGSYLSISKNLVEHVSVSTEGMEANAVTDTQNDNPVPDIIIGKKYDFRKQAKTKSSPLALLPKPSAQPTQRSKQPGAVLGSQFTQPTLKVRLSAPANGAVIPSSRPLVQGTGIPGKRVTITLGITAPISDTTTVGKDGIFRYTPKKTLDTGKQSITITTVDNKGKPQAITHLFEVLKSGTQVLGEATPSATLTPTPEVTVTETPTPTPSEEITEEITGEPLPTPGSPLPLFTLIGISLLFIVGGAYAAVKI